MAGVQLKHLMLYCISTKSAYLVAMLVNTYSNARGYTNARGYRDIFEIVSPAVYPRLNYIDTL